MAGKPMILVLVGPTAVGKTEVALRLAERLEAEIVSADSMQVYRGMDIGTAKPSLAERQKVPHHLIDIVDPGERFSVAQYVQAANQALAQIHTRGKLAILTGGTAFYIQAVMDGLPPGAAAPPNPRLRQELQQVAAQLGPSSLYERLSRLDPASAARVGPHDGRRIIRALEIYLQTGQPASTPSPTPSGDRQGGRYSGYWFGLTRPRASLYQRIAQRVDSQLRSGLVEEVRRLLEQGWNPDATSQQALGYKEIVAYLRGEATLAEATQGLIRSTRHYAKRQLSWWRRDRRIRWLDLDEWSVDQAAVWIVRAFQAETTPGVDLPGMSPGTVGSPGATPRSPFLSSPDVGTRPRDTETELEGK